MTTRDVGWGVPLTVLCALWVGKLPSSMARSAAQAGVLWAHGFLLALTIVALIRSKRLRLQFGDLDRRTAFRGVGLGVAAFFLFGVTYAISASLWPEEAPLRSAITGSWLRLSAGLLVGVSAAIVEEWLFRGVILRELAHRVGHVWSVLASASLFAAYHLSALQLLPTLVLGLLLGKIASNQDNLWLPVLVHSVVNLLGISAAAIS